jgi:hypothetical protein
MYLKIILITLEKTKSVSFYGSNARFPGTESKKQIAK